MTLAFLAGVGACEDRVPSPTGALFAQYTLCSRQNPCTPEVVITNRSGTELRRFAIRTNQGRCGSILNVQWAGEDVIVAECHGNPSLSYYDEVDATTGEVLREYLGYGFVRSPDLTKVAHVGWIIHFAPPWVQSQYLQVGNTILYPLPPGMKPVVQKPLEMAPEIVTGKGLVYAGVHEFQSGFAWSPDSRRVGFIDCLVDYRLRDDSPEAFDEGGKREKERCFVVAVGLPHHFVERLRRGRCSRFIRALYDRSRHACLLSSSIPTRSSHGSLQSHAPLSRFGRARVAGVDLEAVSLLTVTICGHIQIRTPSSRTVFREKA
ncbi:MAG TPA: hypothetical protein VMJ34_04405 [Bryobacteraceae bacterium]|nr:hypothetical protein [Bryobacteraceae bacterium]